MAKVGALGRGLSSLIPNKTTSSKPLSSDFQVEEISDRSSVQPSDSRVRVQKKVRSSDGRENIVDITLIDPNSYQPRKYFDEAELDILSSSIKEYGILQPLVVTESEDGRYHLIAGERRLHAAKRAGLSEVPVSVRSSLKDQQRLELALIENIHRSDLNIVEEARAYQQLSEEFELTQEHIAQRVGKSRSAIANILRLLELPVEVQRGLIQGDITEGHARLLCSMKHAEQQLALFKKILDEKLTVRQTELFLKKATPVRAHTRSAYQDPDVRAMQQHLEETLQTRVSIRQNGAQGVVAIPFRSKEDLRDIVDRMKME